ncbi:MAG: thiamine diphosphokinase [Lactobacillales bacterium]|jgi:thiamine pyrophosphokinase|nr:thiamine diphosphokinase [Lactobacillales bacterium]
MIINIVCGGILPSSELFDKHRSNGLNIGVDAGAKWLFENGYQVDIAIGDFDSVDKKSFEAKETITSSPIKDDTDSQLALVTAIERFPNATKFQIFGALGKRIDHELVNLNLAAEPRFTSIKEKIKILDEDNEISYLGAGTHVIEHNENFDYIGFSIVKNVKNFAIESARYTLEASNFEAPRTFGSNEFIGAEPIRVSLAQGLLMVIKTK